MQSATTEAAISPHLPIRQDWLERRHEEIIEPELPIIDPHHHLVDRPETGRYLLPQLLADTGSGHNITATVYLEWLSAFHRLPTPGPGAAAAHRKAWPRTSQPTSGPSFFLGLAAMTKPAWLNRLRH
jgi:hypothetical protein